MPPQDSDEIAQIRKTQRDGFKGLFPSLPMKKMVTTNLVMIVVFWVA